MWKFEKFFLTLSVILLVAVGLGGCSNESSGTKQRPIFTRKDG